MAPPNNSSLRKAHAHKRRCLSSQQSSHRRLQAQALEQNDIDADADSIGGDGGDGNDNTPPADTIIRTSKQATEDDESIRDTVSMQYTGWTVPKDNYALPTINIADLTPESFFNEYINNRRPVVLTGMLTDLSGIEKWKDNNYLLKMVGEQSVMVERRTSKDDTFGEGNKTQLSFQQFLHLIVNDRDDMHYLTTQDVNMTDGRPDLMSPLMKALSNDFPLRPILMGSMVPQNINLWIGNATDGASSGLHHDYHDNLYIVLRGRKRFRLYSPIDAKKMYTTGELVKVHSNGRINYKGEETSASGADPTALAAWRKHEAEKMLEDAERALAEGKPGAMEQVEQAELLLDMAMDAMVDAEIHEEHREHQAVDSMIAKRHPNNFSKVDVNYLEDRETLKQKYPKFLDANTAFCNLETGSLLYLPASWFHEVTSYGAVDGHMAMNYWFHPPDNDDFVNPYSSDYWANDFSERFDSYTKSDLY